MKYQKILALVALLLQLAHPYHAPAQYYIHRIAGDSVSYGNWDSPGHIAFALNIICQGSSICLDDTGNIFVGSFWSGLRPGDGVIGEGDLERIEANTDKSLAFECWPEYGDSSSTFPIHDSCFVLSGMCFDAGYKNLLVVAGERSIRKINIADGSLTTIAGDAGTDAIYDTMTGDGGPATSAWLTAYVVTIDSVNNIYFSDPIHNRIRKIDAVTGIISTFAGNGAETWTGDGGPAVAAGVNNPLGIYVQKNQNALYIADEYNNCIRKVNLSTNKISTVAGNDSTGFSGDGGPATAAALNKPCWVHVDDTGNMYIADLGNLRVRKVNTAGMISTIAGNDVSHLCDTAGDNGPATDAPIAPYSIDVDKYGNVFVGEGGKYPYYHSPWGTVQELTLTPLLTGNITGKDTVCATKTDTLGITVQWTGYNAVWSVTNANAAISATGVATGLSPGRDTVVYTVSNGAGSTAQTTFPIYVASKGHCDSISGIQTIAAGTPRVLIYPNPATTIITVLDPNADKYEITDLSGRSLLSGKLATGASQIDIRSLAPGAYVVLLYRGQIMERRSKLIKQ